MGEKDWAVVIGLTHYPGLTPLDGPENDANLFYKWLVKKSGGAVPRDQIIKIVSSDFQPPANSPTKAMPGTQEIESVFEELEDRALQTNGKVGRRLYLFMAGHGFADLHDISEQTALLTARATRKRIGHHILGQYTATWFRRAGYFDEVILFMDCCRTSYPLPALNMPWDVSLLDDALDSGRFYHGFAAQWSRAARERIMEDGKAHGVFTWALVKGLEKSAADPDTGEITAKSLSKYLYNHMKDFLGPSDEDDAEVATEPDIDYPPNHHDFVIAKVRRVAGTWVTIELPPDAQGQPVQIIDGDHEEVAKKKPRSAKWRLRLNRGLYGVIHNGKKTLFEVGGSGDVIVKV